MRGQTALIILLCLAVGGCGSSKSTDELISDLKVGPERDRVIAIRLLPQRKADADKILPLLIECLKDKQPDLRVSAAIGLGSFGEQARAAIPDLEATGRDPDARVRRAASAALARIDPQHAPQAGQPAAK